MRFLESIFRRFADRRVPAVAIAVGAALALPSVGSRYVLDDNTHAILQRAEPGVVGHARGPLDLFVFADGTGASLRAMVREGVLAWWTADEFKNAFFRPLSSATHVLDGFIAEGSARFAHAHTIAWYAVLVAIVAWVFRRIESRAAAAGAGAFLYAIDHVHGHTIGWNANRNAIVAAAFALSALALHDRARKNAHAPSAALALGAFVLALLAGEIAVGVLGYLVAYALVLDRAPLRSRALSLLPYACALVSWRVVYASLGYGSYGSDAYLDPVRDPLDFAIALPWRLAMLAMGQLGAPSADLSFWSLPDQRWLLALPAGFTVLATLAVVGPALARDAVLRFWAIGALLAAVPMCASFSSDRHLVLVGVGAMGALTASFATWLDASARSRIRGAIFLGFAVLHGPVSLALFPLRAATWNTLGEALDEADLSLPHAEDVVGRTVVIAAAPLDPFASWLHVMRARRGTPRPEAFTSLAVLSSPVTLTRIDSHTVRVAPERGFLLTEPERLLRGRRHPLGVGDRVELASSVATVETTTPDGRPLAVRFRFHETLESPRYAWFRWGRGRYESLAVPGIGDFVTLPATDLVRVLFERASE